MDITDADRIRTREVLFHEPHPNPDQAGTAARFLAEVEGVIFAAAPSPNRLRVRYDPLLVSLREIESALTELGLHLDGSLMQRLRRALFDYAEETLRANHGHPPYDHCVKKVFAKRYELIEHGCRDDRPEHWRRYL